MATGLIALRGVELVSRRNPQVIQLRDQVDLLNFRWAARHAVFGIRRAALLLTLPNTSRVGSSTNDRITEGMSR